MGGSGNGMSRPHGSSVSSSVMFRKLRRLRVTVIFYTCGSLCAILLLVNFNEDVKKLLQQSHYSNGPHENLALSAPQPLPLRQQQQLSVIQSISMPRSQQHASHQHQHQNQLIESSLVSSRDVIINFPAGNGETSPSRIGTGSGASISIGSSRSGLLKGGGGERGGGTGKSGGTEEDTNPIRRELNVVASGSVDGVSQHEAPNENEKPWFMWRGTKFPQPLPLSHPPPPYSYLSQYDQPQELSSFMAYAGDAQLWHEDNPNSDRIVGQLMYAFDDPINYPNGSFLPPQLPLSLSSNPRLHNTEEDKRKGGSALSGTSSSTLTVISAVHDKSGDGRQGSGDLGTGKGMAGSVGQLLWDGSSIGGSGSGGSGPSLANVNSASHLVQLGGGGVKHSGSSSNNVLAVGGGSGGPTTGVGSGSSSFSSHSQAGAGQSLRVGAGQQFGRVTTTSVKTILLYYGLGMSWGSHITQGRHVFLQQKCPVNACRLTGNRAHMNKADAVVFKDVFMNPKMKRLVHQLWIMYMLECPLNTQNFIDKNVFNMTATYRHDSDIVTPYEKWVYYDPNVRTLLQSVNFGLGKTKKVAWFVSNCVAKNNRLEYARELGKYIEVDIYGACGTHSCSRANAKQCFDLLSKHYKFYLAFENSNCRDYISEKFFVNGLGNKVLPIVMGAHPDDYKRVAPEKSYIHVDDFASPKELAAYLHQLDSNDELYNDYFKWKGTGEFVNTHFFCRLCAMVHYAERSDHKPRYYDDFNKWWRGSNVCTRRSWRNQPDIFAADYYDKQNTYHHNKIQTNV